MIAKSKRAVIYCRMSSDRQEESIPRQLAEIKAYAKRHGFTIIREYADEAMSGDAADREAFNRLIRDAERKGDFDVILCWDQNRFSRFDTITANHYWYVLREAGVGIVTVNQGEIDFDDLGSMIVATIDQHSANKFLKDLGRVVCSGLKRAAEKGGCTGRLPYGYRLADDGRIEIDDEAADNVRRIFDSVLNRDTGLLAVVRDLTARKVPTPNGNTAWRTGTIRHILTNEAYIGRKVYGRKPIGKHCRILAGELVAPGRGDTRRGSQSLADCVVVKDAYPPIITPAMFRAVGQIVANRATPQRTRSTSYVLSGIIFCGHCGGRCCGSQRTNIVGRTGKAVKPFYYYTCASRKASGAAAMRPECRYVLNRERIEAMVKYHIEMKFTDEKIREYSDWQRKHIERIRGTAARQVKALAKRLAAATAKLQRLEDRVVVAPDDMLDMLYRQIRGAKDERDGLAMELSGAEAIAMRTDEAAGDAGKQNVARVTELRNRALNGPPDVMRRAIAQMVERIVVFTKTGKGRGGRPVRELDRLEIELRRDILSVEQSAGADHWHLELARNR